MKMPGGVWKSLSFFFPICLSRCQAAAAAAASGQDDKGVPKAVKKSQEKIRETREDKAETVVCCPLPSQS